MAATKLLLLAAILTSTPHAPATAPTSNGRVLVLSYSPGVFQRVVRCHMARACGVGNYIAGFRPRADIDGFTAVNWSSRWMVAQNIVVVAKLYDPKRRVWVVQRLQAADYQQKRHATAYQRLEVDGATAARLHFPLSATHAIIVGYERQERSR